MSVLTDRIDEHAKSGKKKIYLYLWLNTAKRLRRYGFKLYQNPSIPTRLGEGYFKITWKDAVVYDLPENWVLDEELKKRCGDLTMAQVMWLKAEDYSRTNN